MKALWLALPLLGCVDTSEPQLLPEGTTGVDTVNGVRMPWTVIDGEKFVSDDLSLGPALDKPALYAAGGFQGFWDQGLVAYCIRQNDPDGSNNITDPDEQCTIRRAIAGLSVDGGPQVGSCNVWQGRGSTPLHFVEFDCAALDGGSLPYIDYEGRDTPTGKDTTRFNFHGATVTLPSADQASVQHETGHALGLYHEHQRPDRDQFVRIIDACRRTDVDVSKAFEIDGPEFGAPLTPYDVDSIMQYPSWSMSVDLDHPFGGNPGPICPPSPPSDHVNTCPTQLFIDTPVHATARYCRDGGVWEQGWYKDAFPLGLSPEDVNAFAQMYEPTQNGACQANQSFGGAMAAGDLDGDGYGDLAVARGHEISLYKGTVNGLVFWETLAEGDFSGTPSATDRFGEVLAVGKLSGTNPGAELFVGAPGYNSGKGAVYVYQPRLAQPAGSDGSAIHPVTEMKPLVRLKGPNSDLYFGSAFALGKYTADDQLAVSATSSAHFEGRVEIMQWTGTAFDAAPVITINTPAPGTADGFGSDLASGDLDGVGNDELSVGAPTAVVQGQPNGAVYTYSFTGTNTVSPPAQVFEANPYGNGDRFGAALKIGKVINKTSFALVVGAPAAGPGRIVEFAFEGGKLKNQGSTSGQSYGDQFGSALRLADVDGDQIADIVIGAPNAGNGQVKILRSGIGSNLTIDAGLGDRGFGAALAVANFDGAGTTSKTSDPKTIDLVVGAPTTTCTPSGTNTTSANAGAFTYFRNDPSTRAMKQKRRFSLAGAVPAAVVPR